MRSSNAIEHKTEYLRCIAALHAEGYSDRKIASVIGHTYKTVGVYRRELKLPTNNGAGQRVMRVSETEAQCSKCKTVKPISQFTVNRAHSHNPYHMTYCFTCRGDQARKAVNRSKPSYFQYLVARLNQKCRKRAIHSIIKPTDVLKLWEEQQGNCFYTGVPMTAALGTGYNKNRCSIDKIVPSRGYTPENIVLCTQKANTVKNNLTLEEMSMWLPGWYALLKEAGKA